MSHDQLKQIILDAYDARTEIKEYFEFFLNPDVDKLLENYKKNLLKELQRSKWGDSKMRVLKIKRMVKEFEGFNPGTEAVLNMLFMTVEGLGAAERHYYFTQPQYNLARTLVKEILLIGDKYEMMSQVVDRLTLYINQSLASVQFKSIILETMDEWHNPDLLK